MSITNEIFEAYREDSRKEQKAREYLRSKGYQTANLWSTQDVKTKFDCTEEEAMDFLERVMDNEWVIQQIWESMDVVGDILELKRKGDEDKKN